MNLIRCVRVVATLLVLFAMLSLACTGRNQKPRTREDIFNDRITVDTLYLTDDGKQTVAPGTVRGVIVDAESGKLAWRAWQCDNPDCPLRNADGSPFLFARPDPFAYVTAEGEIEIRQPATAEDFKKMDDFVERKCPACAKILKPAQETAEQQQQYQQWVSVHVLPQAEMRLKKLDDEYRRYLEVEQRRSGQ